MVRVGNLEKALQFYCGCLGMAEIRRYESEQGRFTLVMLAASEDEANARADDAPMVELTWNWDEDQYDGGRNFGHLAFRVENIYQTCQELMDKGISINRPPRDGRMAFIRSPDNISIELLQKDPALPLENPDCRCPISGNGDLLETTDHEFTGSIGPA
jgi:lactoylglutathione lyase